MARDRGTADRQREYEARKEAARDRLGRPLVVVGELEWECLRVLADEVERLRAENAALRAQIAGHCQRIADQSDALSRAAEKRRALESENARLKQTITNMEEDP